MTFPARFPDGSDLSWTAFRYVAGETSSAEADAFEARLADDQAAREAVAAAVELSGAIALLDPVAAFPSRPRKRGSRAMVWVATGIAAGLMLGFGFDYLSSRLPTTAQPRMAEEVVRAWSDLRRQADDPDALTHQLALNDDTADLAATLALVSDSEGEPPSWMSELATLPPLNASPRSEN